MKSRTTCRSKYPSTRLAICAGLFITTFFSAGVFAQAPAGERLVSASKELKLEKLAGKALYTPELDMEVRGATGGTRSSKQQWFEVKCLFDTAPEWSDDVTFTYYVLTQARKAEDVEAYGGSQVNILKGRVTHTSIAKGSDHLSSIYLKPKSFLRFGKIEAIGVEVESGGETLTLTDGKNKGVAWWKLGGAPTALEGHLLAKDKTPFALYNYDEYEEIK